MTREGRVGSLSRMGSHDWRLLQMSSFFRPSYGLKHRINRNRLIDLGYQDADFTAYKSVLT